MGANQIPCMYDFVEMNPTAMYNYNVLILKSYKKLPLPPNSALALLGVQSQRFENWDSHRDVHSSMICDSQKMEQPLSINI